MCRIHWNYIAEGLKTHLLPHYQYWYLTRLSCNHHRGRLHLGRLGKKNLRGHRILRFSKGKDPEGHYQLSFYQHIWKRFLQAVARARVGVNHRDDEVCKILYPWCGIYTSTPAWILSVHSDAARETPHLETSSQETSLTWSWNHASQPMSNQKIIQ